MDRPRRAALYARALTDDPEDGLSWDNQLSRLREYAEILGVEVYAESMWTSAPPPTGERPRFQEMLREGTDPGRPFDIVLVLDDTQLPRLGDDFDRYGDQLRLNLVEIWTVR